MAIEQDLVAALIAHAGTAALVARRIHPLALPERATLPAIVYRRISGPRLRSTSGSLAHPRFQFSCFARTLAEVLAIAEQVRQALDSQAFGACIGALLQNDMDVLDPDLGTIEGPSFHRLLDFEVFYPEA